jgi:hypothetical protein
MNVGELALLINAKCVAPAVPLDREVVFGYSCDLLSWVMAHAKRGAAWITVQSHMNVIAVAALMDLACVILPENIIMEDEILQKAADENIAVLACGHSAYELCGLLFSAGIMA